MKSGLGNWILLFNMTMTEIITNVEKAIFKLHNFSYLAVFVSFKIWSSVSQLTLLLYQVQIYILTNIQLRMDAITYLKYWFWISSILERTKNSTKPNNTSFERAGSGLFKSWRLEAWHSYWPATPTLCDKLDFLGEEGVASPWGCHAPVLQEFFCPL